MPADAALVQRALDALEPLIGLAPGEIPRRRLARDPALLARALRRAPDLDDPDWAAVVDAVTVQETRLFRNPAQLELLRLRVLPELVRAARVRGGALRLLSAGCATGEEAWTLAALGQDALRGAPGLALEVVGLDLSRPALDVAAAGRFPPGPPLPLRDVPQPFRGCFPAEGRGHAVAPALRRAVRFARANLLGVEDAAGFDAILCRNVCIYLTEAARAQVVRRLAGLLRPGGALLLGATDTVPPDAGLAPWSADMVLIHRASPRHG